MPSSFPQRLFNRWLMQNRSRFHHPPMAIRRRKGHLSMRFTGVAPLVWGHIDDWGNIEVRVDYQGKLWDMVVWLDICPERLPGGGYVCRFCDDDTQTVYPTRESIWIEHGFEALLEWCNTHFQADQWVTIWGMDGGNWVTLRPLGDTAETAKPEFVAQYPLLCG